MATSLRAWLIGASAPILTFAPLHALAQGAPGPIAPGSRPPLASLGIPSSNISTSPAPTVQPGTALGEIVVTAERRTSSVQKSSLAIQVLSPQKLASVQQPQNLTQLVPGLQIGTAGPNPQVYIRGVGDTAANSRSQPAVALNLDGVYLPRGSQLTTQFYDLARIEVLEGPQGTLYGRNASGGALNFITNRPVLDTFSGDAGAEFGNYNLKNFDAAVNIPIGDKLALRVAGQVVDRDGYLSDGGQDQRTQSARVRGLWRPVSKISLLVNLDVSHIGGQGSGVVLLPQVGGDPWRSNTQQPLAYPFQFSNATLPYSQPNDRFDDAYIWGVSAELNADLGWATLTILPSHREQSQQDVAYSSTFRFFESLHDHQDTVEARLARDTSHLKFVLGGYYYEDHNFDELDPLQNTFTLASQFNQTIQAEAAFGQATLTIVDGLRLIGGLRYTHEQTSGDFQNGAGARPLVPFAATGASVGFGPIDYNKLNYKAGAEYDLAPQSMLYATVSTGFKAGGVSQTAACGADPFNPEQLAAYDAGARNRFLGGRLQVNVEGFYWDYTGQQVTLLNRDPCGGLSLLTYNVGSSTIKGGNADITWRITPADTIHVVGEYADGTYDNFSFTQFGLGAYAPSDKSPCSATALGGNQFNINCSGQALARLPKYTGQIDYSHTFNLPDGARLVPTFGAQLASSRFLDVGYGLNGTAPGYFNGNIEINYYIRKYSITAYVDNFTNAAVYTGGQSLSNSPAPNGGLYYGANIDPPRTYGLRLRAGF